MALSLLVVEITNEVYTGCLSTCNRLRGVTKVMVALKGTHVPSGHGPTILTNIFQLCRINLPAARGGMVEAEVAAYM